MNTADCISSIINGYIMPALLIFCGAFLAVRIKLKSIIKPSRFIKTLRESASGGGSSPVKAMCTALAGTLGVGNIAGVATAITAGGPGAIMWMWIGAVISMSVKYGEVALAVKYRRTTPEGGFCGGSMYTIRDGLGKKIGYKSAYFLGGIFAVLCLINSFVTGNIVQSNSAASVFSSINPYIIGAILGGGVLIVALFGMERISSVSYAIIPPLSGLYILLSVIVIFTNLSLVPEILSDIVTSAFSVKAAAGGICGIGIREAVRFGITRGIFSNEAGCGTAPTAHASANVKSPHHQGCFGIFEVIADTLILCTMTAFVVLIAEKKYTPLMNGYDGVPLTLVSFKNTIGALAYYAIGISVILFAFATIIAQIYYGSVAIGYFTQNKIPQKAYVISAAAASVAGSGMDVGAMWICADLTVGVMTCINILVLLSLSGEIAKESKSAVIQNQEKCKKLSKNKSAGKTRSLT